MKHNQKLIHSVTRRLVAILGGGIIVLFFASLPLQAMPAVMVSVEAMGQQADDVVLTYAVPVTETQIRQDVNSIAGCTGWKIDDVQITSGQDSSRPQDGVEYSAQLLTSVAVDRQKGDLPIASLVMALRRYRDLMLIFDVSAPFTYTGKTAYKNGNVLIEMLPRMPGSLTFAFRAAVKNPSMSRLDAAEGMGSARSGSSGGLTLIGVLTALLIASLIGIGSYALILRLMLRSTGCSGS